jgi:hypothetical protein
MKSREEVSDKVKDKRYDFKTYFYIEMIGMH